MLNYHNYFDDGTGYLGNYNFKSKPAVQHRLPGSLLEISGITNIGNRVFAITDEVGKIYELDITRGKVVKKFFLGRWTAEADFEGLAYFNGMFAAAASNGRFYFFKEGSDGQAVDYEIVKTGLRAKNNVEGLCYDKKTNSLLIACKDYAGKDYDDYRAVYSFDLESMKLDVKPRFLISLKKLKKQFDVKKFHPSGIVSHPSGNSFFILYSKGGPGIVEVSSDGDIIGAAELNNKMHRQPEGITFINNEALVISDEGAGKKAAITKYEPRNE